MIKIFLATVLAISLTSCAFRPQRPGWSWFRTPEGAIVGLEQSENPKDKSTARYEKTEHGYKIESSIGGAQKDTAREVAAKLSSLKGIVWLGGFVFLFGLASLFYPPLKLIIGSTTTSAAIAAGGLALIVLPTLVVGNELLIFGGVAGAIGLWFLAHRHGKTRGALAILEKK